MRNHDRVHPTRGPAFSPRAALAVSVVALTLAGCAQQQAVRHRSSSGGKEYFSSKVYGAASPRVVADGQAVPRGGGKYLVGRPYSIAGRMYYPSEKPANYSVTGMASWYGAAFHGRRTANGEVYDMRSVTAAHPTMPLPSYARVTNLRNNHSIIVRVNDRGPYHGGRVMDVSQRVAEALDFRGAGTAKVKVDYLGRAGLGGSDDSRLMATLRMDGPANASGFNSGAPTTMVAEMTPPPVVAPVVAPVAAARPAPAAPPAPEKPSPIVAAAPEAQLVATTELPRQGPTPPQRPFDLGTIPGAGVPIGAPASVRVPAPARAEAPEPPRRLSAIYYAEPMGLAQSFETRGPFVGLTRAREFRPWREAGGER